MAVVVVTNRIPESGMAKLRAEHEAVSYTHLTLPTNREV